MIESALMAGCLTETLAEFERQEVQQTKLDIWLMRSEGKSYRDYWGEDYG